VQVGASNIKIHALGLLLRLGILSDSNFLSSVYISLTLYSLSSLFVSVDESLLQVLVGILGSLFGLGAILAGAVVVVLSLVVIMVVTMAMTVLVADSVMENLDLDEVKAKSHDCDDHHYAR
jgi:hypothetical protein